MFNAEQYQKHRRNAARRKFTKHLPWALRMSEHEISLKFGGMMTCSEVRGPDPESCSIESLLRHHADTNRVLKSLGDGYVMNIEVQCDPMGIYPGSDLADAERWKVWPDHACYLLDEESREMFESGGNHVDVKTYLSLTHQFPPERTVWASNLLRTRARYEKSRRENYAEHIARYRQTTRAFIGQLGRLMHVKRMSFRETLEYFHSTVSTRRQSLGEVSAFGMIDRRLTNPTVSRRW